MIINLLFWLYRRRTANSRFCVEQLPIGQQRVSIETGAAQKMGGCEDGKGGKFGIFDW
jgi:hypothetical protein